MEPCCCFQARLICSDGPFLVGLERQNQTHYRLTVPLPRWEESVSVKSGFRPQTGQPPATRTQNTDWGLCGVKVGDASRGIFLPVFSSATKNQVCEVMWNGASAMVQSHWNPPRGSQLVTAGPACCAAWLPWVRDGGDAGRLCGFSTRGVAFRRFDTIFASSGFVRRAASEPPPPLLLLLRPRSLARPPAYSLARLVTAVKL